MASDSKSPQDPGALRLFAPAKINLRLELAGRRPDGFHELSTTMLALELGDELRAAARTDAAPSSEAADAAVGLSVGGPEAGDDVPRDGRNLVLRAARAALVDCPRSDARLDLHLVKRVPSRAGLGGGSADAAAGALAAAWLGGLPSARFGELEEPLAALGSDCPFFLVARETGHGWCTGRGELVEPLNRAPAGWHIALVVPTVECPTADIYARLRLGPGAQRSGPEPVIDLLERSEAEARGLLFNGLEIAAIQARPELGRWRALLGRSGLAHFRLSGSGSAFFGLYRDADEARADLGRLVEAAGAEGLGLRYSEVTRPSGRGVALL